MSPGEHGARYVPGQLLGSRFRIVQLLGHGGMGEVYEAADLDLNQHVALKLVRPESQESPKLLSLLRDEVRKARSVSHRNVCRVYDLERDDAAATCFVTMELIRGETLHARLRRTGIQTPVRTLPIVRQIADGMDAIHARQMLHLDLKPANVMLESGDTESPRAVVMDFGLATSHAPLDSSESTYSLLEIRGGTRAYMSPERFFPGSRLTAAADVYAFGLIVYEMLTGAAWSDAPGAPPPTVPNLPAGWNRLLKGCLSPAPEDRFRSCGEAVDSIEKPPSAIATVFRGAAGRRRAIIAIAALAVLAAAALVFRTSQRTLSPTAQRWYDQGVDAIREGTYYKAVRALDQSLKESPTYPLTRASLAEAWLELDSPERAGEELLKAGGADESGYRIDSRQREFIQAIRETVTRNFSSALAHYQHLAHSASPVERPGALVDLGRALEKAKEPKKALEQYEAAVHLDSNYAGAYLRIAVVAGQLQQWDRFAQALAKADMLYDASSNLEGVTEVFYQRGTFANRQARSSEALQWLEKARQSAMATQNPHQEIRALYQLSAVAYQKGDTATGQKFAEDAIRHARDNNIEFLAGRGFNDLGNALTARGEFAKATEYFNEALRIARNYHGERLEATALYSLGSLAIRMKEASGARQVEKALTWFQANGYPYEASLCLLTLGRFRRDRGELDAAAQAFNNQLQLARAAHDDLQTALALSSVGSIFARQERFPEALQLALEQTALWKRLGDGRVLYAQQSLATVYTELGRFAESATVTGELEAAARKGDNGELLAGSMVTRARVLLLSGRPSEAAALATEGVRAFETKYPRRAGGMLEISALARSGASSAERLAWCERGLKLSQGSYTDELSLRLTKAELLLSANRPKEVLDLCGELVPVFKRQQSEFSLYKAEILEVLAYRQLRGDEKEALSQAADALQRFQKRFDAASWAVFAKRWDFVQFQKKRFTPR